MSNETASITSNEQSYNLEETPPLVHEEALNDMGKGLLDLYRPDLEKQHDRVKEILRNQGVLIDITQNEKIQLEDCEMIKDIEKTFNDIKVYQKKLVNMKKNMKNILDRSEKAKVRAQKLMIQKQKEELHAAQEKERLRKYEIDLTAKPASEYQE